MPSSPAPTTWLVGASIAVGALAHAAPAAGESLRCNGQTASEGDSRISVLHKCGRPSLQDAYCAPVFYGDTLHPVPDAIAAAVVPCQPVEVWLYDRGPGQLMASVRFRGGVVASIVYGQQPR
ncbi:MAG TPA: DUF2845 domain-containing protein [Methylibium sp.]|uniref:DUF2845 domain-containing protein n=1 Tax=Methylibium sp. TaxID=2067992 RepID=UPI002DB67A8D|nr:DUF2845 domain-containing protein [Methylibium sp.]HEU4458221.1 DUF2845 domain-containing protein [Methylibium sp.]